MELTELENTQSTSLSRIPSSVNHRDGRHRAEDTHDTVRLPMSRIKGRPGVYDGVCDSLN